MLILAIETSCDETSVAITKDTKILSNVISSQVELHKKYGGVVPILAQRAHRERIDAVLSESLKRANSNAIKYGIKRRITLKTIDSVAVTYGPGLAPALEVGVAKAKELAQAHNKRLIKVNHMEGHIYANFANGNKPKLPALCILVSGKHTELIYMEKHGSYEYLGQTLDDAIGEAFDKIARMLDLGYPGGKIIEDFAAQGNEDAYPLPVPLQYSGTYDFSYSGLKTAVLYTLKKIRETEPELSRKIVEDMCASFQKVAVAHIIQKTKRILKNNPKPIKSLILGGGVAANKLIRKELYKVAKINRVPLYYPDVKKLCTDNAAMIAIAAYHRAKEEDFVKDINKLERDPRATLTHPALKK